MLLPLRSCAVRARGGCRARRRRRSSRKVYDQNRARSQPLAVGHMAPNVSDFLRIRVSVARYGPSLMYPGSRSPASYYYRTFTKQLCIGRLVLSGRLFSKYEPPIEAFPHIPEAPFAAHHGALWRGMALPFGLKKSRHWANLCVCVLWFKNSKGSLGISYCPIHS